jgi:hypothetical protein
MIPLPVLYPMAVFPSVAFAFAVPVQAPTPVAVKITPTVLDAAPISVKSVFQSATMV